jgi:Calcineurin-like phosphoesterase
MGMRTAVLSDLHLGLSSGGDVLRDPGVRRILLEEIGDADRVILLGDVVELRERPLGPSLELARPFFEDLGAALGEREVTIVPGNHDHRFAEQLLDERSLADAGPLGLEHSADPSPGPTAAIAAWLGPARLRIAYPGLWLRDDVYATHGHYMDPHLDLPRAECIAVAALIRLSRKLPEQATAADYERVLRPIYGFAFGVAQARSTRTKRERTAPSEVAWKAITGNGDGYGRRQRLSRAAIRNGFPVGVWALNRLLDSSFQADLSAPAFIRSGVEAATEMATRLGIDGTHVITGHSHRAGPMEGDGTWPLPAGGSLHNTGSWVFSAVFHHPDRPPDSYWPGTVTWVEDEGPPRRTQLLLGHSHAYLVEATARSAL